MCATVTVFGQYGLDFDVRLNEVRELAIRLMMYLML